MGITETIATIIVFFIFVLIAVIPFEIVSFMEEQLNRRKRKK